MTEPTGNRTRGFRPALIGILLQVRAFEHLADLHSPTLHISCIIALIFSPKMTHINWFPSVQRIMKWFSKCPDPGLGSVRLKDILEALVR